MTALEETRLLIRQWRIYKAWAATNDREAMHYARLAADFALVIRERIRRYAQRPD